MRSISRFDFKNSPENRLHPPPKPVTSPPPPGRDAGKNRHRRRLEWATFIKSLVDDWYKDADKIVLVMDQLNTHSAASLYEAFAPEEAKRIAGKLEIHHTPKHGSWLNMAEIELSALGRQCLVAQIQRQKGPCREAVP